MSLPTLTDIEHAAEVVYRDERQRPWIGSGPHYAEGPDDFEPPEEP